MDVGKVDPIMNQLEGMADFNLLKYVNDDFNDSLLDRLGLSVPLGINSPVPVRSENNHKLQDANASDYITLESSPPQIQQYYTIDTEEIHSYHGNTEVPSPEEVADNAISVVAEENPAQFNDRPTHIVLDSSDNVMNLGDGSLPLFLHANPSEQHIFMTQDTTDGIFIITGTGNGDSTIPQAIQISQSPSSASLMESLIVGENDLSPTDVAIASPSPASPPPPAKTSSAKPRASRRQRPKKPKKYEITESLKNPVEEKKRLNAINAKKNREMKKDKLRELGDKVEAVTKERDQLLKEVEELKRREKELRELLLLRQQNNLRNNVL